MNIGMDINIPLPFTKVLCIENMCRFCLFIAEVQEKRGVVMNHVNLRYLVLCFEYKCRFCLFLAEVQEKHGVVMKFMLT
jgi:hypothetical protein